MDLLQPVLLALSVLVVGATGLSLLRSDAWWIRVFEFPRVQLLLVGAAVFATRSALHLHLGGVSGLHALVLGLLALAMAYQLARILPYTRLWRRQVVDAGDPEARLSLLISNVLMDNRDPARLVALVAERQPDLVLLAEPDALWREAMAPFVDAYPHRLDAVADNTYGLFLMSRLPLEDAEVRYLVEPVLPSFRAFVRVGGQRVRLVFVHPKPPAPQEAAETTNRDAELLIVGREIAAEPCVPTVVAGDLNDVAWSQTTRLFQKISGLLDPRRGRGLYATFHADYWPLRWPLDHVFHTDHFGLVAMERLPHIGSDHFPVWVELGLCARAEAVQEAPEADADDQAEASETIERALTEDHEGAVLEGGKASSVK